MAFDYGFGPFENEVIKKNTRYSSPITTVQMSSGMNVVFGVNFGEGKKKIWLRIMTCQ